MIILNNSFKKNLTSFGYLNRYLKFSNKNAIIGNLIQKILYVLAYPIAKIAKKIGFTPNGLTLISCIFVVLAFVSLVKNNLYSFLTLWFIAYILDYADGTLARMINSKGKTALNYDHISDLLKISLIFLGFGLYYNNQVIWILTFSSATLYLFYTVLNHELKLVQKLNSMSISSLKIKSNKNYNNKFFKKKELTKKDQIKLFIKKIPFFNNFILSLLTIFLSINGHTLLIFFFIPLNYNFATILLTYFVLITTFQSIQRAEALKKLKKI